MLFPDLAIGDSIVNVGKSVVTDMLKKKWGIDFDPLEDLANEAKKVGYEKQIAEGRSAINKARKPEADVDRELADLERSEKVSRYRRNIAENNNAINNANKPVNERDAEVKEWSNRKTIADAQKAELELEEKRRKRQETNG